MRRMTRALVGAAFAAGMFVSLGNTAMAKTYTLSEILEKVHQGERQTEPFYYFEGGEEMLSGIYPQTGVGPYFAPGDRIVSDIPGAYLLTANPEMDNIKKLRSIIAAGHGTYNRADGAVGETIGEGAPTLISIYDNDGKLYDTFTEGSGQGIFGSMHIVSKEDEEAVYLLSNLYGQEQKGTVPKSYRGYCIPVYYSGDGTIAVYSIHVMAYDNVEPNAEQYYAKKTDLDNVEQIQAEKAAFDAAYYAENNPDIAATVGVDPEALWQHYMMFGCMEGRKAHP